MKKLVLSICALLAVGMISCGGGPKTPPEIVEQDVPTEEIVTESARLIEEAETEAVDGVVSETAEEVSKAVENAETEVPASNPA